MTRLAASLYSNRLAACNLSEPDTRWATMLGQVMVGTAVLSLCVGAYAH